MPMDGLLAPRKFSEEKLFLLQQYDNGDFFIYGWTTILAGKGYKVLTSEQAAPLIELSKMKKNNVAFIEDKSVLKGIKKIEEVASKTVPVKPIEEPDEADDADDADDEDTQEVVKEAISNPDETKADLDEVREISVDQETMQAREMKYIRKIEKKNDLEEHMLKKYQCEIPEGRLSAMKAIANSMISDLAKENRLYLVDNSVKIK